MASEIIHFPAFVVLTLTFLVLHSRFADVLGDPFADFLDGPAVTNLLEEGVPPEGVPLHTTDYDSFRLECVCVLDLGVDSKKIITVSKDLIEILDDITLERESNFTINEVALHPNLGFRNPTPLRSIDPQTESAANIFNLHECYYESTIATINSATYADQRCPNSISQCMAYAHNDGTKIIVLVDTYGFRTYNLDTGIFRSSKRFVDFGSAAYRTASTNTANSFSSTFSLINPPSVPPNNFYRSYSQTYHSPAFVTLYHDPRYDNKPHMVMVSSDLIHNSIPNIVVWNVYDNLIEEQFYTCNPFTICPDSVSTNNICIYSTDKISTVSVKVEGNQKPKVILVDSSKIYVYDLTATRTHGGSCSYSVKETLSLNSWFFTSPISFVEVYPLSYVNYRQAESEIAMTRPAEENLRVPYLLGNLILTLGVSVNVIDRETKTQNNSFCCYPDELMEAAVYVRPEDENIGVITTSADNKLLLWDLASGRLVGAHEGHNFAPVKGLLTYVDSLGSEAILSWASYEVSRWPLETPAFKEEIGAMILGIFMNFLIVLVVIILLLMLDIFSGRTKRDSELTVEELNMQETKAKFGITSQVFAFMGSKAQLGHWTVRGLSDYKPRLIYLPFLGGIYATKLVVVFYFLFIGLAFSPDAMPKLFGVEQWSSPNKQCILPDEKIADIEQALLEEFGFSLAQNQILQNELFLADMVDTIDEYISAEEGNPEFDRLSGTSLVPCSSIQCPSRPLPDSCETALAADPDPDCHLLFETYPNTTALCNRVSAGLAELQRQALADLEAEISCTRTLETHTIKVFTSLKDGSKCFGNQVGKFFSFGLAKGCGESDVAESEIQTFGGQEVPCEVNPDLLSVLGMQNTITKYQNEVDGFVANVEDAAVEAAESLITKLFEQVQRGADIYIVYVCFTLYVTSPLVLYVSGLLIRYKRKYFSLSQALFVFLVVLFFWTYPYFKDALNAAELLKYLHNAQVDVCYLEGSFLKQIQQAVIDTCDAMDALDQNNSYSRYYVQEQYLFIIGYNHCTDGLYEQNLPDLYNDFELKSNISKIPFVGHVCKDTDSASIIDELTYAPGAPPTGLFETLIAFGIIAQLFAKIFLVNFGHAIFKMYDPLAVYNGKVEVVGKDTPIPLAIELEQFLRTQAYWGVFFWGFMVAVAAINLMASTASDLQGLRDNVSVDVQAKIIVGVGCGMFPVFLLAFLYFRHKHFRYRKRVTEKLKLIAAEDKFKEGNFENYFANKYGDVNRASLAKNKDETL